MGLAGAGGDAEMVIDRTGAAMGRLGFIEQEVGAADGMHQARTPGRFPTAQER